MKKNQLLSGLLCLCMAIALVFVMTACPKEGGGASGHSVILDYDDSLGLIEVTPSGKIKKGTEVEIVAQPETGYVLGALKLDNSTSKYGLEQLEENAITKEEIWSFVMPDADVKLTAVFSLVGAIPDGYYKITVGTITNGTANVTPIKTYYAPNEDIAVGLSPSPSTATYNQGSFKVTGTGGDLSLIGGAYPNFSFKMPAYDVTITAAFTSTGGPGPGPGATVEIDDVRLVHKTNSTVLQIYDGDFAVGGGGLDGATWGGDCVQVWAPNGDGMGAVFSGPAKVPGTLSNGNPRGSIQLQPNAAGWATVVLHWNNAGNTSDYDLKFFMKGTNTTLNVAVSYGEWAAGPPEGANAANPKAEGLHATADWVEHTITGTGNVPINLFMFGF